MVHRLHILWKAEDAALQNDQLSVSDTEKPESLPDGVDAGEESLPDGVDAGAESGVEGAAAEPEASPAVAATPVPVGSGGGGGRVRARPQPKAKPASKKGEMKRPAASLQTAAVPPKSEKDIGPSNASTFQAAVSEHAV